MEKMPLAENPSPFDPDTKYNMSGIDLNIIWARGAVSQREFIIDEGYRKVPSVKQLEKWLWGNKNFFVYGLDYKIGELAKTLHGAMKGE